LIESPVYFALLLSLVAGLSTTLGSVLGLFVHRPSPRFMAFTLGFAGGVMILISFVELLQQGIEDVGFGLAHVAFFCGMGIMFLIDELIPHQYIAEHHHTEEGEIPRDRLLRTGMYIALGIGIHNLPEGMAVLTGTLEDRRLGVIIAMTIAIHNIPEGLAVSVPVYAATGSRKKAFLWSFLSGIAEPIGAILAALVLMPLLNEMVLGIALSAVGGIMIFIALDELVPIARSFDEEHLPIVGIISGMMVIAFGLWLSR
jgi:zinc transporter, ZIP family